MSVKLDRLGHIFTEAISKIINEEVSMVTKKKKIIKNK